jgi:hypothetical protein
MTTSVNYHRIASDCYSSNPCNVGRSLYSCCADTNGAGFVCNTTIADIDIGIACGEVGAGKHAHCNIPTAACVVTKRNRTVGCIVATGCVAKERRSTVGCV